LNISTAGNGTTTIHATFTTQTSPTPSDASSSFIRNSPSSRDPQAIMWFDISPLTGNGPLTTQFSLKTQFSDPSATASYIFGHTEGAGTGRTTDHTYVNAGLYQTLSTAVSGDRIIRTTAPILVLENADFDGDGIEDRVDLCPRVFGLKVYQGCPFIHEFLIDLDARIDGNPTENSSGALFGGDS
jgi:hypothetical protein